MGGTEKLAAVRTLQLRAIGQRYMREQSERPEGPWLLDYFQVVETHDFVRSRMRQERQSRGCDSTPCWRSAE